MLYCTAVQLNLEFARMRRAAGIAFGVGNHVLFAYTVWQLFWFLKGFEPSSVAASRLPMASGLLVDFALALAFAVPHSVLLLPSTRRAIVKYLPDVFYGTLFCTLTCGSLLFTIHGWQQTSMVICHSTGMISATIQAAFYASWVALFYSLSLTGLGYQTGWTPWWNWVRRRQQPPRNFTPRGAYVWLRHPVYLSFLGLIWFVPVVSVDRAVLIAVWSTYIFFGSWLKDCRLVFYLGEKYLRYQAMVPGYPGIVFGPLGRVQVETSSSISVLLLAPESHQQPVRRAA
jgi:protein-S-isoprenylcysteine O-methyltransferase Ste14